LQSFFSFTSGPEEQFAPDLITMLNAKAPREQDHGPDDHPVELAPADDEFLHVLVVIDTSQQLSIYHRSPPLSLIEHSRASCTLHQQFGH
jgi:hypothetical protein